MTLLPSLAQIAAPLLQHDPLHRWAARTNQLNLTWGKRRIWERVSSPRYAAAQQVRLGAGLPRPRSKSLLAHSDSSPARGSPRCPPRDKQATLIHVVHDCLALVLSVHGLIRSAAAATRRGRCEDSPRVQWECTPPLKVYKTSSGRCAAVKVRLETR